MFKIGLVLSLAIITGAAGDILMSKGMKSMGAVSFHGLRDIPHVLKSVVTDRLVLAGVGSMTIYFASYVAALAWVDVSVVVPLTALSYVFTTLYSRVFMHEHVTAVRWGGVSIVTVGAVLVGVSS